MAVNSKDIETLWKQYSEEGVKKGISVVQFFESNGVPYNAFEKWYNINITVLLLVAELVYFKFADKCNIIDKPNERSSHSTIVQRGGGVSINGA